MKEFAGSPERRALVIGATGGMSTAEQNQANGRRKSLPTGDRELMVGHGARLGTRAPPIAGVCQGALA